ncbi:hypothetical protein HanIR_Chr06g0267741 [Helianthus annuus]|nr:hypothetical protein HanIR_Chr06g0267741 [Helianthus annuus]
MLVRLKALHSYQLSFKKSKALILQKKKKKKKKKKKLANIFQQPLYSNRKHHTYKTYL